MQTHEAISQSYARAFAVRHKMLEFREALTDQPGWALAAKFLFGRFEVAFRFFLDAPTPDRLDAVISFEADMVRIARNLPALAKWQSFR